MEDPLADELRNYGMDSPFGRGFALLVVAKMHVRHGRPERAIAIWQQLIREGGKDGDSAQVDYAHFLFEEGLEDEAWDELDSVMSNGRIYSAAWINAAEMLEERGKLDEALTWYAHAADHVTAEEVTRSYRIEDLVTGRRRVRYALGMPLDAIDLLGEPSDDEADERYVELLDLLRRPIVTESRIHVWARAELDGVREGWQQRISAESVDAYYQRIEQLLRAQEQRILVVPWTMRDYQQGLEDFSIPDDVIWPPPRNKPCWCGSGTKYKKCCGRPLPVLEPAGGPAGWETGWARYRVEHGG